MSLFEQIKQAVNVKDIVEKYHAPLNRANKVCCPFHQEKTPSLSVDTKNNMFKCFGCNVGGDGIRFLARLKNIEDYESAKLIVQDFGLRIDFESEFVKSPQGRIREYLRECRQQVGKTDYFRKRGLTDDTIRQFGLGYDEKEKAVVIPYSNKLVYYQRRSVSEKRFFKPKIEDAGNEPLFNCDVLKLQDKTPVFIVESPICAMSIMQYGGLAVALCGGGISRLIDIIKACKRSMSLILALDNDDAGKKTTEQLCKELKILKQKHIVFNVSGEEKDPNELLLKSANKLCRNMEEAMKQVLIASRDRKDRICIQELSELGIKPKPFIVDKMIPEDSLCMLVAASKVGKSWLVLQLAISIITGQEFLGEKTVKHKVLYYGLEDNESRMIYRKEILTNKEPLPKNWLEVKLETSKGNLDTGFMDELRQQVEEMPGLKLIIVDTFQMIRGSARRNEGSYAYDNRELAPKIKAGVYKITGKQNGGKISVAAGNAKSLLGGKPNYIIVDELAAHKDRSRLATVEKGKGKKLQFAIEMQTTAGYLSSTNPAKEEYDYAKAVLSGKELTMSICQLYES